MQRAPWAWFGVALLVRAFVAWRTDVPGRDGASYLWMAEQVARGDLGAAFQTVFHPLYPLLTGVLALVVPDTVIAGQAVACTFGALAIVPLFVLTRELFGVSAAHLAALVYALGIWFVRHPAECMSEGVFFALVAGCTLLLVRRKLLALAGALAALAYATRPEGAALWICGAPWLVLAGERRAALRFTLAFAALALLVPLGYARFADGFTLTPKATFNLAVGVAGTEQGALAFYVSNAARLCGAVFEALGFVTVPLIVIGLVRARALRAGATLLLAPFVLQFLLVPLLRSNERFVLGYGILLLPFAGAAWTAFLTRVPLRIRCALLALVVLPDLIRLPQAWQSHRVVERELGREIARRRADGERVATEMPRLEYFAGQKPGPPRPISAREILAAARAPETRFVAIVAKRTPIDEAELRLLGYAPLTLDPRLEQLTLDAEVRSYERRRR